ncbi:MAG: dethiobiotin synthase [Gemmatimonadota bacterium]|nr:dethiobiotin synthase [Gemmatimonadota bacterium]MDQ8167552.1 dethiobiotin synthase [Gemmatimonadota bacterium]
MTDFLNAYEPIRYGVTGTDTGIGKTVVACALAARARSLGYRVAAMKPVESGVATRAVSIGGRASDADRLAAASGSSLPRAVMCPYVLEEPLAPMIAALRAGVSIDLDTLDAALAVVEAGAEMVLVEGAGGILVPITPDASFLDLFARWQLPLLLVAGNRLGVLNHVLLTVRAAEAAGVVVRAIVLTALSDCDASVAEATNFDALTTLLPHHTILRFPWVDRPDDADALAAAAEGAGFDLLLSPAAALGGATALSS